MAKKITNTAVKDVHPEWLGGLDPESIYRQEKRGQEELVHSDQLPVNVRGDRTILETRGVVFGEPQSDDDLFVSASLPVGWYKRPTDHDMWSELVDDTGTVVATIFYKAAFYDRKAHMNIEVGAAE